MTTTPANDSTAARIAALDWAADTVSTMDTQPNRTQQMQNARTAFAAILDRLERVEAENARLRAFVKVVADMHPDGNPKYKIDEAKTLLAASESEEAKR